MVNEIPSKKLFLYLLECLYKVEHIKNESMGIANTEKQYKSLKRKENMTHSVIRHNLF